MATMLAYPRQGILLNPSPNSYPQSLPFPAESAPIYHYAASSSSVRSTNNNLFLSASSSGHRSRSTSPGGAAPSSSSSAANSPRSQPRKIRFAPLPDPRRSVLVTDDGEELPFLPGASSTDGSDDSINGEWPAALGDGRTSPKSESPEALDTPLANAAWSTPATTPSTSPYPGTTPLSPSSYSDFTPTQPPASPFMSKTRKLFKPLLPTKALSDLKLNVSTEDVLTLGTINLFRTSSRDSATGGRGSRASSRERTTQSDDEAIGAALARSSSSGSARKRHSLVSVPFRRTQSYDVVQKAAPARAASTNNGMQGQRMLNGRVYGARRNGQKNPFANIPDKQPEFVEWGYGGMGSVKAAKESGSMLWAPVHGKVAVAAASGDAEDDGSGAAWLKKRREARAAKEREDQAKAQAEAAAAPSTPTPDADATPTPPAAPAPLATIAESTSAVSTPKGEHAPHHTGESTEYMHTTMCVPAAPMLARPHRSRSGLSTVSESTVDAPEVVGELELELDADVDADKPASDGSSSPAESVDDVSGAEDDVDAEEAARLEARVTAKGASVEVLSKRKRVA